MTEILAKYYDIIAEADYQQLALALESAQPQKIPSTKNKYYIWEIVEHFTIDVSNKEDIDATENLITSNPDKIYHPNELPCQKIRGIVILVAKTLKKARSKSKHISFNPIYSSYEDESFIFGYLLASSSKHYYNINQLVQQEAPTKILTNIQHLVITQDIELGRYTYNQSTRY